MASAVDEKKAQLKARFRSVDKNGDGMLDFNEFLNLMQGLDQRTAHKLFAKVDTGGDGMINFDEFVEYIYDTEDAKKARTTAGRHARLAAMNAVNEDSEDVALWGTCENVFKTYQGSDERFEGKDFKKLCTDCKLFDRSFKKPDADLVFARHKSRGVNTITFAEFQNCIRAVAQKKKCPTSAVQAAVAERDELGVDQEATKADFVRFHDDKTTYTGMHSHNENHGSDDSPDRTAQARQERIRAEEAYKHEEEEELPWESVEQAFYAFCKGDQFLNGKEFTQLCGDCDLYIRGNFVTADADVIFNKVKNRGERKIDWEQFKDACIGVAHKRGSTVADVQRRIVEASGPAMHGVTKADNVRFHDDKSLYTGMHASNERHL